MAKAVHLSDISLRAPKIYVERDRSGELGILKAFVPEKPASEDKPEAAPSTEAAPAEAAPLPIIDIDALSISDGMVLFTDWQPVAAPAEAEENAQEPVKLLVDKIALKGGSLSTRKNSKGTIELSLNINRKGFLRTSGTLGLNPLDLDTVGEHREHRVDAVPALCCAKGRCSPGRRQIFHKRHGACPGRGGKGRFSLVPRQRLIEPPCRARQPKQRRPVDLETAAVLTGSTRGSIRSR